MPLPPSAATGRSRLRGLRATAVRVAPFWFDPAYDRRLTVTATNTTGVDLHDHVFSVAVPGGTAPNAASLVAIETTPDGGVDRGWAWRYGTLATLNRMPLLPVALSGSTVTVKSLGRWPAAAVRTFCLYWDTTGRRTTANPPHLGLVVQGPLFVVLSRLGPDVEEVPAAATIGGLPFGTAAGATTKPGWGFNASRVLRGMTYAGSSFGTVDAASASVGTLANTGPTIAATGTFAFPRGEWTVTYQATYQMKVVVGRKSDDTTANGLNKLVDAWRITITHTCANAYTPAAIAAGQVVASGLFDLVTLASQDNGFGGNVTASAGNKLPNWTAPLAGGGPTAFGASADLSALDPLATIVGTSGNQNSLAVLVVAATLSGFGSQAPQVRWAASAVPYAYLQLRNVSSGATIPQGATIVLDCWFVAGNTNQASSVGDALLPDEAAALLRGLATGPTIAAGAVETVAGDALAATMARASALTASGCQWFADNALAYTGRSFNTAFQKDLKSGSYAATTGGNGISDDDDGNYGEAHKLHGLCLRYLRTHDADALRQVERQVQFHINIEQAAVAAYGSWWQGSAPYWYWVMPTPSAAVNEHGISGGDTDGSTGTFSYGQGQPRRLMSVDQHHMVAHGMYAYLYLLRNEVAVTANATLRASALSYVTRARDFENLHFAATSRVYGNVLQICTGTTPTNANGTYTDTFTNPYYGQFWGPWQISNLDQISIDPSSNGAEDDFFRAIYSPDATKTGLTRFLQGRVLDMISIDYGLHDVFSTDPSWGVVGTYPRGCGGRGSATGNDLKVDLARANGHKHYHQIGSGGARDQFNGRHAQRFIVICLATLFDPAWDVPIETDGLGNVLTTRPILSVADDTARALAVHMTEETTHAARWGTPMYLGGNPKLVDSAFTGYWLMACELWHLVQARRFGRIAPGTPGPFVEYFRW